MIIKIANTPPHEFEKAVKAGFFSNDPSANNYQHKYIYMHTEIYDDGKIRNFFKNVETRELVGMDVEECT